MQDLLGIAFLPTYFVPRFLESFGRPHRRPSRRPPGPPRRTPLLPRLQGSRQPISEILHPSPQKGSLQPAARSMSYTYRYPVGNAAPPLRPRSGLYAGTPATNFGCTVIARSLQSIMEWASGAASGPWPADSGFQLSRLKRLHLLGSLQSGADTTDRGQRHAHRTGTLVSGSCLNSHDIWNLGREFVHIVSKVPLIGVAF